ncbi:hypothetical protein KP509_02G065900 [Ceratopteris richardii]|uniref:Uncharacterized protein n=1 Tax=Ceratopteris richardii TaxID=49495 RepID=A0A8T2VI42_CERRI|nr:hypothetical protein KP509_02G065900 [Ceratopteris richardii]
MISPSNCLLHTIKVKDWFDIPIMDLALADIVGAGLTMWQQGFEGQVYEFEGRLSYSSQMVLKPTNKMSSMASDSKIERICFLPKMFIV